VREEPDEPDGFDGPPADAGVSLEFDGSVLDSGSEADLRDEAEFGAEVGAMATIAPPAVLFDRLRAKALELDRARHASLEHAECLAVEGNLMRLSVATSFHVERVRARGSELEVIATGLLGRVMRIQVELQAVKTQAEESAESRERSRRQRQEALNSEPVNLAIEILDAEIVEIRPLGDKR
jgi:hypothetical protein